MTTELSCTVDIYYTTHLPELVVTAPVEKVPAVVLAILPQGFPWKGKLIIRYFFLRNTTERTVLQQNEGTPSRIVRIT